MRDVTIGYINLAVIDFERSIAFYRDVLGLPLLFSDEKFQFASFRAGAIRFAVVGGPETDVVISIGTSYSRTSLKVSDPF